METYIKGIVYSVGMVGWGRDHLNTLVALALAHFKARFGGQHALHDEFITYMMDYYAKRPGAHAFCGHVSLLWAARRFTGCLLCCADMCPRHDALPHARRC